jgi:predicted deacylase
MMTLADAAPEIAPHEPRALHALFRALAERCRALTGAVAGEFTVGEQRHLIPRFTFLGPGDGLAQRRIGVFALLHGDEPAGAEALLRWLEALAAAPALAAGYDLVCYPVCNPTGYAAGTRHNHAGLDLNREFWRDSSQPEIAILERELRAQQFDGVIALHADDTSNGLYGYAHGRLFNEHLLHPALRASERVLPRDRRAVIDGFTACEGVISDCFPGVLAPPPDQQPRPFEIIFETPALMPLDKQAEAAQTALLAMLAAHRGFIAHAQFL